MHPTLTFESAALRELMQTVDTQATKFPYLAVNSSNVSSWCPEPPVASCPSLSAALLTVVLKLLHATMAEQWAYPPAEEIVLAGRDERSRYGGWVRAARRKTVVENIEGWL